MPDLGGVPKKKLDLSDVKAESQNKTGEAGSTAKPKSKQPPAKKSAPQNSVKQAPRKPQRGTFFEDEDDDDEVDDDDEIIQSAIQSSKNKKTDPKVFAILAAGLIVIVVALFLLLGGGGDEDTGTPPVTPPVSTDEPVSTPEDLTDPNLGIQDFTQDTNMSNDSPLSDPNGFVEDIYGLTTRVEYDVTTIQSNVVDFVNYTKKRGTWGGGLELYWLDCTYKGSQYVIQVPFQYYKELDDTGIVPVKMEVLYSKQPTGETLTVISYMCLDEATLKTLLKSQK